MIQHLRIGLAQINPTVGDLRRNLELILKYLDAARRQGVQLILFPELAVTGYPPEDLILRDDFVSANLAAIEQITRASQGLVAIVGFAERLAHRIYNAAAVCVDGHRLATYHKICLPNYGVFDERRYFEAGSRPLVVQWGALRIGINICEDIWTPAPIAEFEASAGGAHLLVNISASPYHFRKGLEREHLVAALARRARAYFAYVNMVGGQDELVFDGQAFLFDPEGRLLLRSEQFEDRLIITEAAIDTGLPRPALGLAGRYELAEAVIPLPFLPAAGAPPPPVVARVREEADEIFAALVLGTRDYVRKNGFQKVVLGLSGGIDSAVTAVIAVAALGPENVVGVLLPSSFTAAASNEDALALARNLGIVTLALPIRDLMAAYDETLAPVFHGWPRDVTEENIQARIRGNLLMALSNKFNWLVLITSNKSETAVGYSTLYGDMAGGFAVLKDVPKSKIYALARWINQHGFPQPVIPPRTIERPPTAELRPNQTDQDTLPPYDLLDRIIEEYVEEDRSVPEMISRGLPAGVVQQVVRLIDRAEYKRQQAAPGIKISTKNFGKDRRMPITNGFKPWEPL
ncbi:MAG: NAD+ synthase [candidate division KSB1 bacterium]|nr:NAD+ synthase [candidate division KSB1 bacterium]MDZ7288150.1 NAD+ synthase [candidate division KSB1 bacterium]MDZ7300337.1 NAD+ synthase [candidate division KSB1 bacterium]MDZ7306150.1 NAD+ synthase [candidate division KSB1 bacterium]MDZ7351337.1 NAD+ synthase [candidate division KSB1 bacterium]